MVSSFNKRELLEFSNWNIKQSKLPRKFCIKMCPLENSEIINILSEMYPKWNKNIEPCDSYFHVCIESDSHLEGVFTLDKIKYGFAEISLEVLRTGFSFEKLENFTEEDVRLWLKLEKGIIFDKKLKL